jgi:hypothetical protein
MGSDDCKKEAPAPLKVVLADTFPPDGVMSDDAQHSAHPRILLPPAIESQWPIAPSGPTPVVSYQLLLLTTAYSRLATRPWRH